MALLYMFFQQDVTIAGSTTQNNKTEITYNPKTIELLYYRQIYNLSEPDYLWPYTAYVLLMMGEIVARNM